MELNTSRVLYDYWNEIRKGRKAPRRFEIEPARIAGALPNTFILEIGQVSSLRFRLAGTALCEYYKQELRGTNFLDLWSEADREAISTLVATLADQGAVGKLSFRASVTKDQVARFECVLLPLVNSGKKVSRILGSIVPFSPPFWLGTVEFSRQALDDVNLLWPDHAPQFLVSAEPPVFEQTPAQRDPKPDIPAEPKPEVMERHRKPRFKVYEGGLSSRSR